MHGSSKQWRESLQGCVSSGSSVGEQQWSPGFRAGVTAVQAMKSHVQGDSSRVCSLDRFCGMIWNGIPAVLNFPCFYSFSKPVCSISSGVVSYPRPSS